MKDAIYTICGLILLTLAGCLFSGCAALAGMLGVDTEAAAADAQQISEELTPVLEKLDKLEAESTRLIEAAEIAREKGDFEAFMQLSKEIVAVAKEIDFTNADAKRLSNAYDVAVKRFENAKSTGDYLTGILGLLGGALSVFGIGVPVVKNRSGALRTTAANVDAAFADNPERLATFKRLQSSSLTAGEAKALNRVRGK